jgi:hypothetical protein
MFMSIEIPDMLHLPTHPGRGQGRRFFSSPFDIEGLFLRRAGQQRKQAADEIQVLLNKPLILFVHLMDLSL